MPNGRFGWSISTNWLTAISL